MEQRSIEVGEDHIVIRSLNLAINRKNLVKEDIPNEFKAKSSISFSFLLGAFDINDSTYLVVSTKSKPVTTFWSICKLEDFKIIQLNSGAADTDAENLLNQGLRLSPLYFSTKTDLSLNLQELKENKPSRQHFIWNSKAIERFQQIVDHGNAGAQPVVAGFMESFTTDKYEFLLISRRCSVRAGTRLWMRGADEDGYAANFVETEQILVVSKCQYSFVQIRGSIPVKWCQYPNLSRLPSLNLAEEEECNKYLTAHFNKVTEEYGHTIVVSLTDHKGRELGITNMYQDLGSMAQNVRYQYWDFHTECKKLHYENIEKLLIPQIQDGIDKIKYCKVENDVLVQLQEGVVRTNCIDCLDRTNVVQSQIARQKLVSQLNEIGVQALDCDTQFRNIWTDNADEISLQYSGTAALKTDFTRTGKRSVNGALADGKNAIVRYYVNTCQDGTRQDAYDAVTQAVPCKGYKASSPLLTIILAIYALLMYLFISLTKGKQNGKAYFHKARYEAVNKPHFRKIIPPPLPQKSIKK